MKKLMKIWLFIFVTGICTAQAQVEITGQVTDSKTKLAIPGVSVSVQGTTIGTTCDINGTYTISVPESTTTLLFSFIGMKTQTVSIPANTTSLNVEMLPDLVGLDEIVVTAYGTQKKSAFTGSISVVKEKAMREASTISPLKALQGQAAGVMVSENAGQPGSMPTIRIRGIGSINGNKSPLYVIDGIPVLVGDYTTGMNSASALNMINPEDIESQTILKDAAATALYGSRGANGVVIITTKSGKAGKTKININVEKGFSDFAHPESFDYMDAGQYAKYTQEALRNYFLNFNDVMPGGDNYTPKAYNQKLPEAEKWAWLNLAKHSGLFHPDDKFDGKFDYKNITVEQAKKYVSNPRNVNWRDAIFRKGKVQKYDLSLKGGNKSTTFYTSLGYLKQEGIVNKSSFERVSASLTLQTKINKNLSIKFNEKISHGEQLGAVAGGWYYANPMFALYNTNPSAPVYLKNDELNPDPGFNNKTSNPLINLKYQYRQNQTTRVMSNLSVYIKMANWLNFESNNSIDFIFSSDRNVTDPRSKAGQSANGSVARYKKDIWNRTSSNLLKFNKSFKQHNINALAGFEFKKLVNNYMGAYATNYASPKLMYLSNGALPKGTYESVNEDVLISYLSKIDYAFDKKYYLSASWRNDGSSRLSENTRWGSFYSGSAGWVASEEDFLNSYDWLNFLKFKVSYGVTGNLPNGFYETQALYSVSSSYMSNPAIQLSQMENKSLSWEKSYTWNYGFDLTVFDKLKASFELYNKTTKGLINNTPLLRATGFGSYKENKGRLSNRGFDFELSSVNINTTNFYWATDFNISHMVAKIEAIDEPIDSFPYYYGEGEHLYTYKLREWAGINPDNGKPQWVKNTELKDGTRDKTLTSDPLKSEKVALGKGYPDYYGGITNRFEFKNFDLSFLLIYRLGGELYDTQNADMTDGTNIGNYNIRKDAIGKHWQKPGDKAEYGRLIWKSTDHGSYNSNRRLIDADYLKVKNLTMGYTLPKHLSQKIKFNKVRFYFNATDLLTFFKKDYIDPEVGLNGTASFIGSFPSMKTYRFGVNLQL